MAASRLRRLGWLIIAGSVTSALIQGFALDELLHTMITPTSFYNVITMPFRALLPVAAQAGAALRKSRGRARPPPSGCTLTNCSASAG
jgi:hypothetical protein